MMPLSTRISSLGGSGHNHPHIRRKLEKAKTVMGLRGFERRLERFVEGAFSRAFRSGLRPVQLGRRLTREMDDHRTVGVSGDEVVPNRFAVYISNEDAARLAGVQASLERDLGEIARDHARDENYKFLGPVVVEILTDSSARNGSFSIGVAMQEAPGGSGTGSLLLDNELRVALQGETAVLGRLPECAMQLSDPNVSRKHAEIRYIDAGWTIFDLGSLNGTRVNGHQIAEQRLGDGDEITIGLHSIRFEIS